MAILLPIINYLGKIIVPTTKYIEDIKSIINRGGPDNSEYEFLTQVCDEMWQQDVSLTEESAPVQEKKVETIPDKTQTPISQQTENRVVHKGSISIKNSLGILQLCRNQLFLSFATFYISFCVC